MNKKIILLVALGFFAICAVYARAIYDEYNKNESVFTVVYNSEFFYCGEDIVITIDSKNEINGEAIIKLELYWQKECEIEPLIKISDMEVAMDQKNLVIIWPTSRDWDDDNGPFSENNDEKFSLKVYYNNTLISENDEIIIGCSSVW
jgi:hypothetical protein